MENVRKFRLCTYRTMAIAFVVALLCLVGVFSVSVDGAHADEIRMSGSGNNFELSDTSYGATESFVYTATVDFTSGQSAGLVFGAIKGSKYWVFSVDRVDNKVRLRYYYNKNDRISTVSLKDEYFIGNDKTTATERSFIAPKVLTLKTVRLKAIITPNAETGVVNAEFFADNIKRFGVDTNIDLNTERALPAGVKYGGGKIGYYSGDADVAFTDVCVGKSDYSYYSEPYRNQYHFSQYAHWNNDPNGLVYFDGWYHMFYQHYPFGNTWGDMYWGHARSRDLVHWQLLPICLFPDRDYRSGSDGYMWSGSAMVYTRGMSDAIDRLNWFGESGTGLLAFYTRDGASRQDQVIMYSTDGGITWRKDRLIEQEVATGNVGRKMSCRDPKVFPVTQENGKTTLWGMALTGMESNDVWFLKSADLLNWTNAGGFSVNRPECPDVVNLTADDGKVFTVMSFTGREYLVGEIGLSADGKQLIFTEQKTGKKMNELGADEQAPVQIMDYGPDSYATQTFYINDATSAYNGKTISVSWFSSAPGGVNSIDSAALAAARKTWNGGGMTIPVEWGLKKRISAESDTYYELSQTPIVSDTIIDGGAFGALKTEQYRENGVTVDENSANILSDVQGRNLEISAVVNNNDDVPVYFRVCMRDNEYIEIGWTSDDGYYVDRTHAGSADMSIDKYRNKFVSGMRDSIRQTFYILSDNGGLEVFCSDFTVPFYVLTFPSPYAVSASFAADGNVTATITVNSIGSVWDRGEVQAGEHIVYASADKVELDLSLTPERDIMAYSSSFADLTWTVNSGSDVVEVEPIETGATVKALKSGSARLTVSCGNVYKQIDVTVHDGSPDTDIEFAPTGIVSGNWYFTEKGIVGTQPGGDGYVLSDISATDFTYSTTFGLDGVAAALVFRAKPDMSDYLIANYDRNGNIVKLWSPRGEIARADAGSVDVTNIVLSVKAYGKNIAVSINGRQVLEKEIAADEPLSGLVGLNVCAARVTFITTALLKDGYTYSGTGGLIVASDSVQAVNAVYNRTLGNTKINSAHYSSDGRKLKLLDSFFVGLETGEYKFNAVGTKTSFDFVVNVTAVPTFEFEDINSEYGCNVLIPTGALQITELKLNGTALTQSDYDIKNGVLTVYAEKFNAGENIVSADGLFSVKVTIAALNTADIKLQGGSSGNGIVIAIVVVCCLAVMAAAACGVWFVLKRKKQCGKIKSDTATEVDQINAESVSIEEEQTVSAADEKDTAETIEAVEPDKAVQTDAENVDTAPVKKRGRKSGSKPKEVSDGGDN